MLPEREQVRPKEALQFPGRLEPISSFRLVLGPGEAIIECRLKEGQEVAKGTALARIRLDQVESAVVELTAKRLEVLLKCEESRLLEIELQQKKIHVNALRREVDQERNLSRAVQGYGSTGLKRLEEQLQIAQAEIVLLEAKLATSKELLPTCEDLVSKIEQQLSNLQQRLSATSIVAPFAGTIVRCHASPELAKTGEVILDLWDTKELRVRGRVMQHQLSYLHEGDELSVDVEFSDQKPAEGVVLSILPVLGMAREEGVAVFDVLVQLKGVPDWFRPGMSVTLRRPGVGN